jgi:hypothetical protein
MSRTVSTPHHSEQQSRDAAPAQWDELYPSDPNLMASAEGDSKGLAELQRAARRHIDQVESRHDQR